MNKTLLTSLAACLFAFLSTFSMPAVSGKTLKLEHYIEVNWLFFVGQSPCLWEGTVSGDINGTICIASTNATFLPNLQKFSEHWKITTIGGYEIEGDDSGVWVFSNRKWVANGIVTNATGPWEYLIGYDMHYSGVTDGLPVPGDPLSGSGKMILSEK